MNFGLIKSLGGDTKVGKPQNRGDCQIGEFNVMRMIAMTGA